MIKRIVLSVLALILSGCINTNRPSLSDNQEALALIDNGVVLLRSGELERARAAFDMAYQISGAAAALDGLGCVAFLSEDFKSAENLFWRAYEIDQTYNNSLGNLAMLYQIKGEHQKAEELYLRSISEDPKNFRSRNNFAAFLISNKRDGSNLTKEQAFKELLKAEALAQHPLIKDNIRKISSER